MIELHGRCMLQFEHIGTSTGLKCIQMRRRALLAQLMVAEGQTGRDGASTTAAMRVTQALARPRRLAAVALRTLVRLCSSTATCYRRSPHAVLSVLAPPPACGDCTHGHTAPRESPTPLAAYRDESRRANISMKTRLASFNGLPGRRDEQRKGCQQCHAPCTGKFAQRRAVWSDTVHAPGGLVDVDEDMGRTHHRPTGPTASGEHRLESDLRVRKSLPSGFPLRSSHCNHSQLAGRHLIMTKDGAPCNCTVVQLPPGRLHCVLL